ncbi:MAG: CpsD/CapB family tyrosine-protein kinase [Alphaproteobacteria bacterium]
MMLNLDTEALETKKRKLSDFERVLDENHIVAHRVQSKEADIIRFLRTQILQKMEKNKFKTLAISSPRYGDGKTTTAANLAVSIAQDLKQTVLLVDLDLRDPSLAKYLGINAKVGLTDYIAGNASVADCLVRLPFQRISVFPAGKSIDFSSETLGSPDMKKLANELKERYDDRIIIYDMPPLLDQDDPLVFLPHVDAFLLVVKEGFTTTEEVKRSVEILDPSKVIGVVLNTS